ncbi:uncharacterized protein LOC121375765 [Gigantopelta aegis]|uniref:uncharacterized protein LOC121375765 n=1 Tax=Gigantopelta aegis TaxID=1735272 RepID=UPI001B88C661|nr:uncharacterized protein LOC121375765 [Gigantopelta aegis]
MHNLKDIYTDRKKKVSIAVKNLQTSTDSSKEHRKKLAEQNKTLSVMQKNLLKTIDDSSTLIIQKVEEKAEQLKQHVIENISKQTAERDDEVKLLTQSEVAKAEHTLYCQQALSFARAVEFTDMSEGLENKIKTLTRRPELRDIAIQNVTVDLDVFKNMDKILQEPAMVDMLNMKTCIEVTDVIANQMSEVIKVSLLSQGVQSLELQASIKDPKDNRQAVRNKMKRFSSTVGRVLYKAANTGPHEIFVSVNGVQLVDHGIVFQAKHLDAEQAKKLLFSIDDQPRQYQELLLPPVKFDRNKLNYERGNITKDGFLISKDSSSRDRPPTWKCFVGVPSETPIGGPGHNYWQTRVYCGMLESGELNLTAVGAGICPIDKCDDGYLIHSNENAYGIGVVSCRNHKRMCLYVFSQGRTVQDIPIASFKTHASLQMDLGFLLNSDKKILHIIDVLSNKVMHSIQDIDVSKPFLPLFGIYNSDTFDSKLKIIASTDLLSDAALLLLLSSLL